MEFLIVDGTTEGQTRKISDSRTAIFRCTSAGSDTGLAAALGGRRPRSGTFAQLLLQKRYCVSAAIPRTSSAISGNGSRPCPIRRSSSHAVHHDVFFGGGAGSGAGLIGSSFMSCCLRQGTRTRKGSL